MIFELLAKVTSAVYLIANDFPVLFPVKIVRVNNRMGVQDVKMLRKGLGRDKIGCVDVGMRHAE